MQGQPCAYRLVRTLFDPRRCQRQVAGESRCDFLPSLELGNETLQGYGFSEARLEAVGRNTLMWFKLEVAGLRACRDDSASIAGDHK